MKKTDKKKARSAMSDAVYNPGPGIFIDERARNSARRGYRASLRYALSHSSWLLKKGREEHIRLRKTIVDVAQWYWSDCDWDNRTTFVDMKPYVRRARKRLVRVKSSLESLPKPVAHALNAEISRPDGKRAYFDHLRYAQVLIESITEKCDALIKRKSEKVISLALDRSCATLWNYWKSMTGEEPLRNWKTGKTPKRYVNLRGPREFVSDGLLFIQIVLKAMDPNIKLSSLRTSLKRHAADHPKSR